MNSEEWKNIKEAKNSFRRKAKYPQNPLSVKFTDRDNMKLFWPLDLY